MGLELAGVQFGRVVYVERECFAAANLAHKIETGELAAGVIHTDVTTFPYERFRDCFDLITGGFPCQPFSNAGKRSADGDPRHLFPHIKNAIRAIQPNRVLLENVEGIISAKLKSNEWADPAGTPVLLHVCRELERIGYEVAWGIFSAAEVGASHQRKRVFILGQLANSECEGSQRQWGQCGLREGGKEAQTGRSRCAGRWPSRPGQPQHGWEEPRTIVDDSKSGKPKQQPENNRQANGQSDEPRLTSAARRKKESRTVGNTDSNTGRKATRPEQQTSGTVQSSQSGKEELADTVSSKRRDTHRNNPPHGAERTKSGQSNRIRHSSSVAELADTDIGRQSSNQQSRSGGSEVSGGQENFKPNEPRQAEPQLGRATDGSTSRVDATANRVDRLRLLGNGVVPQTAAKAWLELTKQFINENAKTNK